MEEVTSPTTTQQLHAFFNKDPRYFQEDKIEQQSSIMIGSTEEDSYLPYSEQQPEYQHQHLTTDETIVVENEKIPPKRWNWKQFTIAALFLVLAHSCAGIAVVLFRYLQRIHHLPSSDDPTLLVPLPPLSMLFYLNILAIVAYLPRMVFRLIQSYRHFRYETDEEPTRRVFLQWFSQHLWRENLSQWISSWFSYGLAFVALFRSVMFLFAIKFTYASFISVSLLGAPFVFLTFAILGNRDLTLQLKTNNGYRLFLFFFAYIGYVIGTFFLLIGQTSDSKNFLDLTSFGRHFYWYDLIGLLLATMGGILFALQMYLHLKQRNIPNATKMDKETWFITQKCVLAIVLLIPSLLLEGYWVPFFETVFSSPRHIISFLSLFLIHELLGTWARVKATEYVGENFYIGTSSLSLFITLFCAFWILNEPISNFLIFVGVICDSVMLFWLSLSFYQPIVNHFEKLEKESTTTDIQQSYPLLSNHQRVEEEENEPLASQHRSPLLSSTENNHNKTMKRRQSSAAIDLFSLSGKTN